MKSKIIAVKKITVASIAMCLLFTVALFAKENVTNPHGVSTASTSVDGAFKTDASCSPAQAQTDLAINNVRTTILAGGDMWWNLSSARYEIPINGKKHSLFAGSLWIGGLDAGGQLKVAAMTYRQNGNDFWPGPLTASA